MDVIYYHVYGEGCIVKLVVYISLGMDMDEKKMWSAGMSEKIKVQNSSCLF